MKKTTLLLIIVALSNLCLAQKKDDVKLLKQFITISKKYQTPPMEASVQCKKTTNMPNSSGDNSVITNAHFVMQNATNAYVEFGNIEQIVNDSIVLVTLKDIKKIVMYQGSKQQMQKQMLKLGQFNYPDSIYKNMLEKFTIKKQEIAGAANMIVLESKQTVNNTNVPKEIIMLQFNNFEEPVKVSTIKRGLKQLSSQQEKELDMKKYQIVTTEKNGKFWVFEETEEYEFTQINHNQIEQLPVKITDRITPSDDDLEYKPAKGFEQYTISKH